eukprot:9330743-Alexandrium_andersonii.AAC.1
MGPCRTGCNYGAPASTSLATSANTAGGVGRPPNRLCASAPRRMARLSCGGYTAAPAARPLTSGAR